MNEITPLSSLTNVRFTSAQKQVWKVKSFSYEKTPRPDHGLMFLYQGKIDFIFGGEKLSAKAGDIVYLPQNCRYEAFFHSGKDSPADYLVNFYAQSPETVNQPTRLLKNAPSAFIEPFERTVRAKMENKSDFYLNGCLFFLLDLIAEALQGERKRPFEKTLRTAEQMLSREENLSIKEIATSCNVSESGLRKLFFDAFGESPIRYRQAIRIKKAAYLLESTDLSTKEIAFELNFYDESHFCRTFLKLTGKTPKQYIKERKL